MQYAGSDFLGLTYVPEVFAEVTAGTAGNVHLCVVLVTASGAFPLAVLVNDYLTVKAALVAVVTLGVELCVLNVVIDELNDFRKSLEVMTHIRNST